MTTFADVRKEIFESGDVFGNTDLFAESFTYKAGGGGPARVVSAACRYEKLADSDEPAGEDEQERMWVQVARDPACERGGIEAPELGDWGLRATDSPADPWSFQGEIRNETPHGWELLFARNRPRRYGP